jgi:ATP synthase protein I
MGAALRIGGAPHVEPREIRGTRGTRTSRKLRAARLASVGIELAVSIIVGLLGGRWLDQELGTDPWLMLVGLLIGVAAGFRSLIAAARKAQAETASETDDQDRSR